MIIEIPNFINSDDLNKIRNASRNFLPNQKTTVYNRDGKTVNISTTPELKEVDDYLCSLFSNLQKDVISHRFKPYPTFLSGDSGYEYHMYQPGEICHYHSDYEFSLDGPNFKLRYATVIVHLNDVADGGELIFPSQNKKVTTEAGKVVIFPPYGMYGHYTTPSSEQREVIVTWFTYKDLVVVKQNAN